MLLNRYGIVFRDLLAREANLPRWRDLQMAFRRLEDPRRDSRRQICGRISGRAVRSTGSGGIPASDAQIAAYRRNRHTLRGRSTEFGWNCCTRRTGAGNFRQDGRISRRSSGRSRVDTVEICKSRATPFGLFRRLESKINRKPNEGVPLGSR